MEMCRQMYDGDLRPDRQADIEKAMLNWLAGLGHEVSESSVRVAARKLHKALTEKGKN